MTGTRNLVGLELEEQVHRRRPAVAWMTANGDPLRRGHGVDHVADLEGDGLHHGPGDVGAPVPR